MLGCSPEENQQAIRAMDIIRGKWALQILCALLDGPVRLSQLKRQIPGASKKALTANLRTLAHAGMISRCDLSESVLHVEYQLIEALNQPLMGLLKQLALIHGSFVVPVHPGASKRGSS